MPPTGQLARQLPARVSNVAGASLGARKAANWPARPTAPRARLERAGSQGSLTVAPRAARSARSATRIYSVFPLLPASWDRPTSREFLLTLPYLPRVLPYFPRVGTGLLLTLPYFARVLADSSLPPASSAKKEQVHFSPIEDLRSRRRVKGRPAWWRDGRVARMPRRGSALAPARERQAGAQADRQWRRDGRVAHWGRRRSLLARLGSRTSTWARQSLERG
jgi:hypothetical protein